MKYNPHIHHRRSIRLKGYDYSLPGYYFITICVKGRLCLFGNVQNGEMVLNDAGKMIHKWFVSLSDKFPNIVCDPFIVMPNHVHTIIEITTRDVGADQCVCPEHQCFRPEHRCTRPEHRCVYPEDRCGRHVRGNHTGLPLQDSGKHMALGRPTLGKYTDLPKPNSGKHVDLPKPKSDEHVDLPKPNSDEHVNSSRRVFLPQIIQWFKTMTTNEYIRRVKSDEWQRFSKKLWQRNYWEHIIRDERAYNNIYKYVVNNAAKWEKDTLNSDGTHSY